jgi:hypothetical protein
MLPDRAAPQPGDTAPAPSDPASTWIGDIEYLVRRAGEVAADSSLARYYRDAIAVLRGEKTLGRPVIDDTDNIAAVLWLVETGRVADIEPAARQVAEGLTGEYSTDAATKRIARKARKARGRSIS